MRTMLLISVFTAATICGEESAPAPMRQKLHTKILETLPPPQPEEKPAAQNELDLEIVEIEPLVVTDSPALRDLAAKIESDSQRIKDAQFTPIKGGTIYKRGSLEIGTWGDRSGLTLLKMSF
jgi:hypothetical protein